MRTFKQFAADEWNGLTGGLAADRQVAREKRQAAWAPYGSASRYYLSGTWKAFIVLTVAAVLGLLTTIAIVAAFPGALAGEAWAIATFTWFPVVGIASGLGRRPSGTREISTGPMLKNLFFWTPVTIAAYGWFAFCAAILIFGGFGLLLFGMRYLGF